MLLTIIMQRGIPQSVWRWYGRRNGGQANIVFAFILSVTEVNAMLANKHFCKVEVDGMLGFPNLLAEALVCNPYYKGKEDDEREESPRRLSRLTKNAEHRVFRLPKGKKFFGTEVVDADSSHPQSTCVDCKRKTRTCCICSMGVYRCVDCCLHHSMEAVLSPSSPD